MEGLSPSGLVSYLGGKVSVNNCDNELVQHGFRNIEAVAEILIVITLL